MPTGCRSGRKRYSLRTQDRKGQRFVTQDEDAFWVDPAAEDELSFAGNSRDIWVERGLSPHSAIVNLRDPARAVVDNAREPILSADGQSLAFVRDYGGRGQLMVRRGFRSDAGIEVPLTGPSLNVYEASFLSEKEYAFSAVEQGRPPQIYDGVWNLWLRDQRTGSTRRLADVPCNQIQPSWEDGSKTLLYGTDCGRSLWFTAVARRRVVP
jgi:hypothetical protein